MKQTEKKKGSWMTWVIYGIVGLVLICGCAFTISVLMSDSSPQKKSNISMVNLMKPPPPPPPIKEKPPELEPQIKKTPTKEQILDSMQNKNPNDDNSKPDDKPAGKSLGLDAEGTAGSDGFGLVANKGGSGLIGGPGGGGGGSLYGKFGWYTSAIQDELQRKVKKRLDDNGVRGKLQTIIKISLDQSGKIIEARIVTPSGDHKMDSTVEEAIKGSSVGQAPPEGMPKTMNIKFTFQG